jgi:hypothetical protein
VSTLAEDATIDKTVSMDPDNAVQHMVNVKIICEVNDANCNTPSVLKIAGENIV